MEVRIGAEHGRRGLSTGGAETTWARTVAQVLDGLLAAVYPERCWFCGRSSGADTLCAEHALPAAPEGQRCGRCDRRLPPGVPHGRRCATCRRGTRGVPPLIAVGDYAGSLGLRELVLAFKHAGRVDLAEPLGGALARRCLHDGRWSDLVRAGAVALVPVPLHPLRRFERGHDQARLLARAAAERLGVASVDALRRVRATAPQGSPGVASRRSNVRRGFGVRARAVARLEGRSVLLVDDVVTSGATLGAAATTLRARGVRVVGALVCARAGGRLAAMDGGA